MSIPKEGQQYYADNLGVIDQKTYQLLGKFFENHGPSRVLSRLSVLMEQPVELQQLAGLNYAIEKQIGTTQFSRNYRSANELNGAPKRLWANFQGAVNEVICEVYLRTGGVLEGRTLISAEELMQGMLNQAEKHPSLEVKNLRARGVYGGIDFAYPDALGVKFEEAGSGVIDTVFEHKSTTSSGRNRDLLKGFRTSFSNPMIRLILRDAVASITQADPSQLRVLAPQQFRTVLVTSEESVELEHPNAKDFTQHISLGIPSIKRCAFFILEALTKTGPQAEWHNYFTVVDSSVAAVMDIFSRTPREQPKAGYHIKTK